MSSLRYDESPLTRARRAVELELKGEPFTPADAAWLHHHPTLWLRALVCARRDNDEVLRESRAILESFKAPAGLPASPLYMKATERHKERAKDHSRVRHLIDQRVEQVKAIIGPQQIVGVLSFGDLVDLMLEFAQKALDGDTAGIVEHAEYWADRFAEQDIYGTRAERDAALAGSGEDAA